MTNEAINKEWEKYLSEMFVYNPSSEAPSLFMSPYCATCKYWTLLNETDLQSISLESPIECTRMEKGFSGKKLCVFNGGDDLESYRDHEFFGWCKRMPPSKTTDSLIKPFLARFIKLVPKHISERNFPIMPHEEWCGEWQQASWVKDHLERKSGQ